MNKTAIEWCDLTWNPVTGCLHGCPYCYARKVANRFGMDFAPKLDEVNGCKYDSPEGQDTMLELNTPFYKGGKKQPYPMAFLPTFFRYKLGEPARRKQPATIFVCSMADLFGDWVPDAWILQVFEACKAAPWHNYLFLTKNPQRYCELAEADMLPELRNFWYGSTITKHGEFMFAGSIHWNTFLSIEPLLEPLDVGIGSFGGAKWIIIGAETGNRAGKVRPEREWIDNIVEAAKLTQAAVFMKDSLIPIVGEENMLRELPEGLRAYEAGHGKNKEAHDGKK